jgi:hypothetical protein
MGGSGSYWGEEVTFITVPGAVTNFGYNRFQESLFFSYPPIFRGSEQNLSPEIFAFFSWGGDCGPIFAFFCINETVNDDRIPLTPAKIGESLFIFHRPPYLLTWFHALW